MIELKIPELGDIVEFEKSGVIYTGEVIGRSLKKDVSRHLVLIANTNYGSAFSYFDERLLSAYFAGPDEEEYVGNISDYFRKNCLWYLVKNLELNKAK